MSTIVKTSVLFRPSLAAAYRPSAQYRLFQVRAATTSSLGQSTSPIASRKAVTVANDTGRVPWNELSVREKAARTTQQSFNFGLILLGAAMTVGVGYILYSEVFSTESKTAVFNRVVDRIKEDPRCVEVLAGKGHGSEIEAYGEASWSRWARNRFIASRQEMDKVGVMHMNMHFYVSGPACDQQGTVYVHMVKGRDDSSFSYYSLALDVPGHDRIWLENAEASKLDKRAQGKMFGVKWW